MLSSGDTYSIGSTGGEATHTLTIDEMPSHNHSAISSSDGDHNHSLVSITGTDDLNFINGSNEFLIQNSDTTMGWPQSVNTSLKYGSTGNAGSHSHSLTVNLTGGSNAHNNLPPYITSIPCIKAFDSVIDATTVSVAQLSDTKVNKDLSNLDENGRKVIADGNLTKSGWTKLANGLILQWGSQYHGDIYENSPHPISFNIPFPNDCLQVIVSTSETQAGCGLAIRVNEPTKTTFSYATYEFAAVVQSATVLWFAVGY